MSPRQGILGVGRWDPPVANAPGSPEAYADASRALRITATFPAGTPPRRTRSAVASLTHATASIQLIAQASSISYSRTFTVAPVQPCAMPITGTPAARAARQPITSGL
jgi:hypothetical protein